MDSYKEITDSSILLKNFSEKELICQNLNTVHRSEGEIEDILDFHFSDFEEKCVEIRKSITKSLETRKKSSKTNTILP